MDDMVRSLGPCEACGKATRGPLCGRCMAAVVDEDGVRKVIARLEIPEPTELEKRRLARCSPIELLFVGCLLEGGDVETLSEALGQIEDVRRLRSRRLRGQQT